MKGVGWERLQGCPGEAEAGTFPKLVRDAGWMERLVIGKEEHTHTHTHLPPSSSSHSAPRGAVPWPLGEV